MSLSIRPRHIRCSFFRSNKRKNTILSTQDNFVIFYNQIVNLYVYIFKIGYDVNMYKYTLYLRALFWYLKIPTSYPGILFPVSKNGPGIGRSHDLKISSIWGVQLR